MSNLLPEEVDQMVKEYSFGFEIPEDLATHGVTILDVVWVAISNGFACRFENLSLRRRAAALVQYLQLLGPRFMLPFQSMLEGDAAEWAVQARDELLKQLLARAVACTEMTDTNDLQRTLASLFSANYMGFSYPERVGNAFAEIKDKHVYDYYHGFSASLGTVVCEWWTSRGRFQEKMSWAVGILRNAIEHMNSDVQRETLRNVVEEHRQKAVILHELPMI